MRLLVVEDKPDLLAGLVRALRKEGHAVYIAAGGEEGLYKARATDCDAIALDVMLPRLDGWAVLAKLRESKATPVLMLTARDRTADRVRGLDTGADDCLVKSFDMPELLARLRAIILRGGEPAALTAREYVVLEYIAMHRGEILTRTALYEHLFDEDEATLTNILDVDIFNLRKKLGHEFIVTRRGHGYCIEV